MLLRLYWSLAMLLRAALLCLALFGFLRMNLELFDVIRMFIFDVGIQCWIGLVNLETFAFELALIIRLLLAGLWIVVRGILVHLVICMIAGAYFII